MCTKLDYDRQPDWHRGMKTGLQTLTLNTAHLESVGKLFAALGFALQSGRVDKGSAFLRGVVGPIELTFLATSPIPSQRMALRIHVQNIEEVVARLRELEKVQIIMDVEFLNQGKTAMVVDPDGRSIEICSEQLF